MDLAKEEQDDAHDEHFTDEDPAPGGEGGHRTSDERSGGHGDSTGGGDQSVGGGPPLLRDVAGNEGHDGRHDQRGTESFEQ